MTMNTRSGLQLLLLLAVSTLAAGQTPPPTYTVESAAQQVYYTAPASDDPAITLGFDAAGGVVHKTGPTGTYGYRGYSPAGLGEIVDQDQNRIMHIRHSSNLMGITVDARTAAPWSQHYVFDVNGKTVLEGVDWESSSIAGFAADLGIPLPFPDTVQIAFNGPKTISSAKIYTMQDNYTNPIEPTPELRFTTYGITDFEVQYWYEDSVVKKWVVVPSGVVIENRNVMRSVSFPPVTTTKLRVVIKNALLNYSRVTEVEVFGANGVNVALQQNGGVASASSTFSPGYPASAINNGERKGAGWGAGAVWNDATYAQTLLGGTTAQKSEDASYRYVTYQNPFAKVSQAVNLQPPPTTNPPIGQHYQFATELTEVKGKSFRASLVKSNRGIEIWDNQGGAQLFGFDSANRLRGSGTPTTMSLKSSETAWGGFCDCISVKPG